MRLDVFMERSLKLISIVSVIVASSCAAMSQKHKANAENTYYEDLSTVRPAFINPDTLSSSRTTPKTTVVATYPNDVAKKITIRTDSIIELNKKYSTVQGFRILVYAGSSSDEAQKIREQVYAYNSDLDVYTQFKQPSHRVKVGNFVDRVEANYMLNDLKVNFPNAMIVPDQINLVQ
jgi:hypothetical protein